MVSLDAYLRESPRGYLIFEGEIPTYANPRLECWAGATGADRCAAWLTESLGGRLHSEASWEPDGRVLRLAGGALAGSVLRVSRWRTDQGSCFELMTSEDVGTGGSDSGNIEPGLRGWQALLSSVSHELSNRLTALGSTGFLMKRNLDRAPEYLNSIEAELGDINGLLRDFCAVVTTGRQVNTAQLLDRIFRLQEPLVRRHQVQVHVDLLPTTVVAAPEGTLLPLFLAAIDCCLSDHTLVRVAEFSSDGSAQTSDKSRQTSGGQSPEGRVHFELTIEKPRDTVTAVQVLQQLRPLADRAGADLIVEHEVDELRIEFSFCDSSGGLR